MFVVLAVSGKR